MPVDVVVPSVGESITEVFIGPWLKQQGDAITRDESIVEIETDKATLEVPASASGVLSEVLKQEGETATVGEVIARITAGTAAETTAPAAEEAPADPAEEAPADAAASDRPAPTDKAAAAASNAAAPEAIVMPAARRLLDEHDLTVDEVRPTGPGGRLLKEDVLRAVAECERQAAEPDVTEAPQGDMGHERREEVVRMTPLRLLIAQRLVEAQQTAALLTTFNEVDMSAVMALRTEYRESFEARHGVRLGFMSFFVKATIEALKLVPQLNTEVRDDTIVYKDYYDIGVAISTKKGLIVPVIRDAERLSFAGIEQSVADFGARAGSHKLTPAELTGGTFTISNGGVFGSLMSTPIVNPPQSGVLGMHTIQERPVALDGAVVIRPMMYIALTYDHRVVDGRGAVTFLKHVKDAVEQPARILLEI